MKNNFPGIIVVEGKNDACHLSSFINSYFVVTNGYEIPQSELLFLETAAKKLPILVMTDGDDAGDRIREKLQKSLQNSIQIRIDSSKCGAKPKKGIAECPKSEILEAISIYLVEKNNKNEIWNTSNVNKFSKIKDEICLKFSLGKCNNKQFIKRLNLLGIKEEELEEFINGNR